MPAIQQLLESSAAHEDWRPLLDQALKSVPPDYLQSLLSDQRWLPGVNQLFSAFRRDLHHCQYILFGESPYPRTESANGIAFYDAAVIDLWSDIGLSKAVNRATSLRNILKTALLAEGLIRAEPDNRIPQSSIAKLDKSPLIQTIQQLFDAFQQRGLLLFNTTPVLHPERKPASEARYWSAFVNSLLQQIDLHKTELPTLLLWGKIAQQIVHMPAAASYPKIISEHPYNLSFIHNPEMLELFAKLRILRRNG